MTLIRTFEALCITSIWALYASVDWIADTVVRAVCPVVFVCV